MAWFVNGLVATLEIRRRNGDSATLTVDVADVPLVSGRRWYLSKGYPASHTKRGAPLLYLYNLLLPHGVGLEVDHRDGNPLNNRRANLRLVTHAQNQTNVFRRGREHLRGIRFRRDRKAHPWAARATLNGREFSLGHFGSREEAAAAVRAFRIAHMPTSNESRGLLAAEGGE